MKISASYCCYFLSMGSGVAPRLLGFMDHSTNCVGWLSTMNSVKKIKGTTDFLDMPKTDRECVHETTEACMKRNLLEECHCTPWELANVQVIGCIIIEYPILSCTGSSNLFCGRERMSHEDTGYLGKLPGERL